MPNVIGQLNVFGDFALCFSDSLSPPAMTTMNPTLSNQLDRSWADRLVPSLNRLLADFEMLRFNARGALWNGWGEQYPAMAEILPHFIAHADNAANAIGRRIRCLEGHPVSTMAECLEQASLKATDGVMHHRACTRMLRESLSHILREERQLVTEAQHAGDEVTAQCLIAFMQFQEETLWTLRTSLRRTAFEEQYLSKESA